MTRTQASRAVYGARTETAAIRRGNAARRHGLETLADALFAAAMAHRARSYPEARRLYEARARELLAEVAP